MKIYTVMTALLGDSGDLGVSFCVFVAMVTIDNQVELMSAKTAALLEEGKQMGKRH